MFTTKKLKYGRWLFGALILFAYTVLFVFQAYASDRLGVESERSSSESIHLVVGTRKAYPQVTDAWIEDKTVLKAEIEGETLYLRALKSGSSMVRLNSKSYEAFVSAPEFEQTLSYLKKALRRTIGLKVQLEKEQVVVRGKLLRWEDWQHLANSCQIRSCKYSMRAEVTLEKQKEFQQQFFTIFKAHSLTQERVEFIPEARVQLAKWVGPGADLGGDDKSSKKSLELRDPDRIQLRKYQRILYPYGVSVEEDPTGVGLEPLVKVNITVAEVRRDKTQQYGIRWPGSYQAKVLPNLKLDRGTGIQFDINALESRGEGRVLASPNILTRSGTVADYLAGGEFPLVIKTLKTQSVEWKKYGVVLKTLPRADRNGRMSVAIEVEVSSIDPSRSIDGIPALFTHRMKNHFDLAESRTIALSGMIKKEEAENAQGLPFLSRIPVLGSLFSSKEFRDNRSEFVIFVRPEIVSEHGDDDASFESDKFIQ